MLAVITDPPPGAPWSSWTRAGRGRCAGALGVLSRVARRSSGAGDDQFQGRAQHGRLQGPFTIDPPESLR